MAVAGENYLCSTINSSCTTPLATNGFGNISFDPLFVDYSADAEVDHAEMVEQEAAGGGDVLLRRR